jgi:hypothetical protein
MPERRSRNLDPLIPVTLSKIDNLTMPRRAPKRCHRTGEPMNAMLRAALATTLLASTAVAETTSRNVGITVTPAGSGATITGLSLSNSSFTGGAPTGTAVGNIVVTTSDGSTPTLSLTGTDRGSGNDANSFQIAGSSPTLQTNTASGTDQPGQYNICIVASGTYSNSPQQICPTIQATGPGGTGWQLTFSDEFVCPNNMLECLSTSPVSSYTWANRVCYGLNSGDASGCGILTVASLPTGITASACTGAKLGACDVSIVGATNTGGGSDAAVNGTFLVAGVPDSTHINLYMPYSGIAATMGGTITVGSGPWVAALNTTCSPGPCTGLPLLASNDNPGESESFDPHACTVSGGIFSINLRNTNVYRPPTEMQVAGNPYTSSMCHIQTWNGSSGFSQTEELFFDTYDKLPTGSPHTAVWTLATSNVWSQNNGPEIDWPECYGSCFDHIIGNIDSGSSSSSSSYTQHGVDISSSFVKFYTGGGLSNSGTNVASGTSWYPIVDVAVDNSGSSPVYPSAYSLDYIRVYKKVTSNACYTSIPSPSTVPHVGTC